MCASIIAKVYRDELMFRYHDEFPQYDFLNNVGYGTKKHLEAIKNLVYVNIIGRHFEELHLEC